MCRAAARQALLQAWSKVDADAVHLTHMLCEYECFDVPSTSQAGGRAFMNIRYHVQASTSKSSGRAWPCNSMIALSTSYTPAACNQHQLGDYSRLQLHDHSPYMT